MNRAHSIILPARFGSCGKGLGLGREWGWALGVALALGVATHALGQNGAGGSGGGGGGGGGAPPPVPGLEGADFRIKEASLRYEGTFISRKVGSMVTLRTGDRAVVFQPERASQTEDAVGTGEAGEGGGARRAERPMILIPGTHLERLEDLAATREGTTLYSLTGQVFVYRGMNYLLLSVPPMLASASEAGGASGGEASQGQSTEKDAPGDSSEEAGAPPEDGENPGAQAGEGATGIGMEGKPESVESIIAQLEHVRQGQRTLERTDAGASEREGAPRESESSGALRASSAGLSNVPAPIAEGKLISRRIGRFVRETGGTTGSSEGASDRDGAGGAVGGVGGGRWALALEGDADSPAPAPMTLVPCAALERLESIAGVLGPGMQVQVSGRVLAYRGQNYLLATMVRLTTPTELKPRQ